jgi:hypothetical protein
MTALPPGPHSRWRLVDAVDRLAVSYDLAAIAIDAFVRAARGYDPLTPRPRLRARLSAGLLEWIRARGWPQTAWLVTTAVLTGSFMAWVSLRLLRQLSPVALPPAVAAIPGILLTLALAGAAALLAASWPPERSPHGRRRVTWPALLLALAAVACVIWLVTWLVSQAGMTGWLALLAAVLAVGVAALTFLAASVPARPDPAPAGASQVSLPGGHVGNRVPRQLLARQRTAQEALRGHARQWSRAARQCGVAVGGCAEAQAALARLVTGGSLGELPPDGLEPFHAQLLGTLARYRLDPLSACLRETSQRLLPEAARDHEQEAAPHGHVQFQR